MRLMHMKTSDGWMSLGEVSSAGAQHLVRLTRAGRTAFEANRPDSILLRQDGSDLYVQASFVRNAIDWRVVDDGVEPAKTQPMTAPKREPEAPADEPTTDEGVDGTPDEAPVDADGGDDYESRTKAELTAECDERALPKSGNKGELVLRLREDDASNAE